MKTGIFPLQIVSFPGELINLHIFEERYRQLINECVDEEKSFVLPPIINGKIKSVANLMVVEHVVNVHEDGAIDIKCRGCEKVRITDIVNPVPGRLYAGADIVSIEESPIGDEFKYDQIQALVLRFQELIKAEKTIILTEKFRIHDIVHKIGLSIQQKYELLQQNLEVDRQDIVIHHLQTIIPVVKRIEETKNRIALNGHFQSFPGMTSDF